MKIFSRCYIGIVFLLLYLPILVLIVFSFNEAGSLSEFSGFTPDWYKELFSDEEALTALGNSLLLAVLSSLIATVVGTFGALGLYRMKRRYVRQSISTVTNIPMMNPDIVTGVSMMLLFVAVAALIGSNSFFGFWTMIGLSDTLGFWTMLIAHVTFNLPDVILSVLPRFKQLDPSLSEAAQDLGCTPARAFFSVELPQIVPGIVSALLMSFTLSLDDFVISHFVSSPNFQTLPLYIYNQTAHNVKFSMYALSALIVFVILVVLLCANFAGSIGNRKKKQEKGVA